MSIDIAPKAQLLKNRVHNIITIMTYKVYRYIGRGLFEKDKTTFKLMASLKILIEEGKLMPHDIQFFLKAGVGGDDERAKQFSWMETKTWANFNSLSAHQFSKNNNVTFKDISEQINRN